MPASDLLTLENYSQGFLIDEELMGGVTGHPELKEQFLAFVLRHTTGEYLGYNAYKNLGEALQAINGVQRAWSYEKTKNCGGSGKCGVAGAACANGGCDKAAAAHAQGKC